MRMRVKRPQIHMHLSPHCRLGAVTFLPFPILPCSLATLPQLPVWHMEDQKPAFLQHLSVPGTVLDHREEGTG